MKKRRNPTKDEINSECMADMVAKPISWLWPKLVARGKVTIIAGNPGLGKSQVTAYLAAIITTGGVWPITGAQSSQGQVAFLNAEDDPADTLKPRLEAAGANLSRVHFPEWRLYRCHWRRLW